uniref:Uncharacterized protein n=1 Tax=Zea mays TaxID=4577 RepID=B6SZT6_MAIZE|nr:hypothetical protein [Zea mays]
MISCDNRKVNRFLKSQGSYKISLGSHRLSTFVSVKHVCLLHFRIWQILLSLLGL